MGNKQPSITLRRGQDIAQSDSDFFLFAVAAAVVVWGISLTTLF
jgi:hypothetical protein